MRGYSLPLLLAALLAAPLFWRLDLGPDLGSEHADGAAQPEMAAPSVLLGSKELDADAPTELETDGGIRLLTVIPTGIESDGSDTEEAPAAIFLTGASTTD